MEKIFYFARNFLLICVGIAYVYVIAFNLKRLLEAKSNEDYEKRRNAIVNFVKMTIFFIVLTVFIFLLTHIALITLPDIIRID